MTMERPLREFLLKQLYVTIGVYVLGFIAFSYMFPAKYHSFLAFLPVIFYIVMAVFHATLVGASNLPVKKFSSRFLAVLGAKIFLFLIFIITYSYFNPQVAVPFLISFFILYIIYTVFEIVTLLRQLRAKKQNQ
jgi:hypothetical protein